ncbi:MAG: Penicillinase repressor [Microgenomates group bacterium GW2011_GWA2_40_6]|nr:MAG: Penicillinase repressor [Microgenomates group bacterium GW2011_GWA2_40_6]
MDVLWSSKIPLKPADVKDKLAGDSAYTTIMTVLTRLADKKIVRRIKSGNTFLYSPLSDKKSYSCRCLDTLFSRLLDTYGVLALDSFRRVIKKVKI